MPTSRMVFGLTRMKSLLKMLAVVTALTASTACAVQESNTYPIEIFSEMHYSQAVRAQESPRLDPVAGAVSFQEVGTDVVLEVPEFVERPYNATRAKELYRVNCATCHGMSGSGDGPASQYLTATDSYWATTNDAPYAAPADLIEKRATYDRDAMINLITNGIVVMPRFGNLLPEADIREIATYIYDDTGGIGH